jgi:hypothetical protein
MTETTELTKANQVSTLGLFEAERFNHVQRVAKMFSQSELVPKTFQGEQNIANVVIALEMAQRVGASALAVMQQIYIVHGKPGWSSQFIIACLNTCGRFEPLRFDVEGEKDARQCIAWTVARGVKMPEGVRNLTQAREANLPLFEGPPCTIAMAKAEGWHGKNGSKWVTMPELMLRYRAATFFGRLYAPELLMGMAAVEEIHDTIDVTERGQVSAIDRPTGNIVAALAAQVAAEAEPAAVVDAEPVDPNAPPVGEPQKKLIALMAEHGITIDELQAWLKQTGRYKDADSIESFALCPTPVAEIVLADPTKCIKIYSKKGAVK